MIRLYCWTIVEVDETETWEIIDQVAWDYKISGKEKCYKCKTKTGKNSILVFDVSAFYTNSDGLVQMHEKYNSLTDKFNYRFCCPDCVDADMKIMKSESGVRFVDKSSRSPVLRLMTGAYNSETDTLLYYRGYKRDKFQTSELSIFRGDDLDSDGIIVNSISECGKKNLYEYVKDQLSI